MQSWSCIATIDPSSHLLNQTFLHVCNSSFRFVLHLLPKRHWGEHLQAKTNYGSSPWLFWQETCFEKLSSHNNMKYPLDPMKHTHGKMGKSLMEALLFCFHWCWGDVTSWEPWVQSSHNSVVRSDASKSSVSCTLVLIADEQIRFQDKHCASAPVPPIWM